MGLAPADPDAEAAVLGACLIANAVPDGVAVLLAPEHFSREQNALIYRGMLALRSEGQPVDIVTLIGALDKADALADCGGPGYVALLIERTPLSSHAPYYAGIVRRKAADRAMIGAAGQIARIAFDGEDSALSKAHDILAALDYDTEQAETGDLYDAIAGLTNPRPSGWSTGLGIIDHWLGRVGLVPGRSLVVSGVPGVGKTTFSTALIVSALRGGARVVDFTLEMTREERLVKIGAVLCGGRAARLGDFPSEQWTDADWSTYRDVIAAVEGLPGKLKIYQDQDRAGTITTLARRDGADVVMIDFYQRLRFDRQQGENSDEVDKRNAEALALQLPRRGNCCALIVSQLNRTGGMKYGAWLEAFCHAHLHLEAVDGTNRVKIEPRKNRWGVNSATGAHAEFEADMAAGRFRVPAMAGEGY